MAEMLISQAFSTAWTSECRADSRRRIRFRYHLDCRSLVGYKTPPVWPVLLKLGPLTIYSYGTMMAIAFLVAGALAASEAERRRLAQAAEELALEV